VAFIMSDITNISYAAICWASLVPALLYYYSIYLLVHNEAVRHDEPRMAEQDIVPLGRALAGGWRHLLPLAALIGLLVLFIARLRSDTRLETRGSKFVAPTHVQDLDIRPESLPPDIGAAGRALWERGDRRAALALLYRGMLSRLAHVHEVPIRDSSTEGDCLALAARTLDPARVAYVTRLVRTWQRFTYGGMSIEEAVAIELFAGFSQNLDGPTDEAPRGARSAGAAA